MLDPTPDEIRHWGEQAVALLADYLGSIRDRPVYPSTSAAAIRERLPSPSTEEGVPFGQLLDEFRDQVIPLSRHNAHPRMFGYVQSPGTPIAAFADLLASGLNANLTAWRSAPAAVEIERATIDALKNLLGLAETASGLLMSGGSMANMAALAAARRAKAPPGLIEKGASSLPQRMCVYASVDTHHSIPKAAALLGLGRANVRSIQVDSSFRINLQHLVRNIERDRAAGHLPFCVVANAGTVSTGAVDPLDEIASIAQERDLWMHVDASYGAFAALAGSARHLFAGLERADSIALDPHKWLYLPVDCGCLFYRDPAQARATFAHDAEYTRVLGQEQEEAFAFWDYGPELSRRFRALKVWMVVRGVGTRELRDAIEKDLACARHLEQLIQASDDFEMLAPVELSIVCFRHLPDRLQRQLTIVGKQDRDEGLDTHNERLVIELQRNGSSYVSNTRVDGKFSLRACVMNYRTTPRDMEILLDDLRAAAAKLAPA